ncbi:glycoside hydrolase family 12 protein [Stipitochalara longipes BDJ]|nr:glycoside hydrolase family 12 protein [Stipitochalara longipes BDJ]
MRIILLFLLPALIAATPVHELAVRQQATLCDQYGYWSGNGYEVNNNMWGKDSGSGSQCTYVDNASSSGVSFHIKWNWSGGQNNVKSYPYIGKQITKGRKINSIDGMQTSVTWNYDNQNIRADVAYDIFTASDPNHSTSSGDYELMIWLGKFGDVQPIGSSVGNVNVGGRSWNLWSGMNGSMKVFSFVAGSSTTSWGGNVKDFFTYLQQSQNYPASSQYLLTFQFGTEPFTGSSATLTVSQFSVSV